MYSDYFRAFAFGVWFAPRQSSLAASIARRSASARKSAAAARRFLRARLVSPSSPPPNLVPAAAIASAAAAALAATNAERATRNAELVLRSGTVRLRDASPEPETPKRRVSPGARRRASPSPSKDANVAATAAGTPPRRDSFSLSPPRAGEASFSVSVTSPTAPVIPRVTTRASKAGRSSMAIASTRRATSAAASAAPRRASGWLASRSSASTRAALVSPPDALRRTHALAPERSLGPHSSSSPEPFLFRAKNASVLTPPSNKTRVVKKTSSSFRSFPKPVRGRKTTPPPTTRAKTCVWKLGTNSETPVLVTERTTAGSVTGDAHKARVSRKSTLRRCASFAARVRWLRCFAVLASSRRRNAFSSEWRSRDAPSTLLNCNALHSCLCTARSAYLRIGDVKCVYRGRARP
mmetsp:Transcript_11354/g.47596  ORF Transcript_11354/g.47596 Transcript_11354/m.47596 type:complete len:409 (+) Transcript_11354:40-1266(+)